MDPLEPMNRPALAVTPSDAYFGIVKYPPGGTHGPRIQVGLQFVHLISGSVEIEIDDRLERLEPGTMAILLPGRREYFRFHPHQESEHSWCQLYFDQIPDGFNDALDGVSPRLPVNSEIEQLIELGLSLTGARQVDNRHTLSKLGESLFHYYLSLDALPASERPAPVPRPVHLACKFIARAYPQPLTLERIAGQAHCSVNHLINQFRRNLDTTPMRYLWRVRLDHADGLLRHTDLPVAVIAEQCGFTSPFHFSRLFKESRGLSPREYRSKYR